MKFHTIDLEGAYVIEPEPLEDERGFFARSFCSKEFKDHGLDFSIVQSSISYNKKNGTLRGMHYQIAPFQEEKLVSCIRGAIYDVIIDLRSDSRTYRKWFSIELAVKNYRMLYIPKGFAHGFQTLEDDTAVFYQISESYHPECARIIRWDDPAFGIKWPKTKVRIMSERDLCGQVG